MIQDWEAAFAPYDEATYQFVVEHVTAQDVVLDIGAGDLRLARRLAEVARKVYAVERNAEVLPLDRSSWPDRLIVVNADAWHWPLPSDVSAAVLLMRHCTPEHFAQVVQRLITETQCQRLFTNARWKMGVEEVQIRSGMTYDPDQMSWYACRCGAIGFTPGDPQAINEKTLTEVIEVTSCPNCEA
jgi:predicted RNA methylase